MPRKPRQTPPAPKPSAAWVRPDHPLVKALQALGFAYDGPGGVLDLFGSHWPGAVATAYARADDTRDGAAPLNPGRVLGYLRENLAGWSIEATAESLAAAGVAEPTRSRLAPNHTPDEVTTAAAVVMQTGNGVRNPAGLLVQYLRTGAAWERADELRRDDLGKRHRARAARHAEQERAARAAQEDRRVSEAKAHHAEDLRVIAGASYTTLRVIVPEVFEDFRRRHNGTAPPNWRPLSDPPTEQELRDAAALRSIRAAVAGAVRTFDQPHHDASDSPALPEESAA